MPFANIFNRHSHSHFFFLFNPTRLRVCSSAPKSNPQLPLTPSSRTIKLKELKKKIKLHGIQCLDSCLPGRYNYLFCPQRWQVNGVDFISAYCSTRAFADSSNIMMNGTKLAPLGHEAVIAFTYRRNGVVVGCKYRTLQKKFWQEKGTKKWLYGLDDIKEASEVIIVEGEIDKLAVEEAGLHNCVSVPCGAPHMVSAKELPTLEKDTAYQYLWNCKDHLDKVSRIILATDVDNPGNALAEELARRLGKERCWRVHWPKKDDFFCFKDANEVLKCLGAGALKEVIENAEPYEEYV